MRGMANRIWAIEQFNGPGWRSFHREMRGAAGSALRQFRCRVCDTESIAGAVSKLLRLELKMMSNAVGAVNGRRHKGGLIAMFDSERSPWARDRL